MDVDLAIVGAGPAGLTLAWKAAEKGLTVVVIDKKKSAAHAAYLTSGSFIDVKGWGIPKSIVQPIDSVYFASKERSFTKTLQVGAHVINRRKLLCFLAEQAEKHGAMLLFDAYVKDVILENKCMKNIVLNNDKKISAKVFADCSGLGRALERHLPLVAEKHVRHALGVEYLVPLKDGKNTIDLYIGSNYDGGYGWLFPIDNKTAVIGYGTFRNFPKAKAMLDKMFDFARVKERVEHKVIETNSGIFRTGKPLKKFHKSNLILVGDICLQGNPVVGEGIRFVMDAARMAADAVVSAVKEENLHKLSDYSRNWTLAYYKKYRAGFLLQRLLDHTTGNDKLADRAVMRASKASEKTLRNIVSGDVTLSYIFKKILKISRDAIF